MASSRHRLLFFEGTTTSNGNLTADRNFTAECMVDCIGSCIYGVCFPSTPISPTPLPYGDVSSNATAPINLRSRNRLLPTLIITATAGVAGSFLLLLALYAYLRFRRMRRRRSQATDDTAASADDNDLLQEDEIEHHVWYIRTQGLDEGTISSIPSLVYRSNDGLVDGRDCSVCLGEFHDGELARLLPKCRHAFHLPCIDRWLRSHVNCPLCRSPIMPLAAEAESESSPASPDNAISSGQVWPEISSSFLVEDTEIEAVPWEVGRQGMIQLIKGSSSQASSSEPPHSLQKEEDGSQPIRRSVSMDSFPLDALVKGGRREGEFLQEENEDASTNRGKPLGGGLKENLRLNLKETAKMERSLSSQSARWFLPRYGRSRNFVLPL